MSIQRFLQVWGFIPTDRAPKPLTVREELDLQDRIFDYYDRVGIVNGIPGSLDDRTVRALIDETLNGPYSQEQQYNRLDALSFAVQNNHRHGIAADVLDEITEAINVIQAPLIEAAESERSRRNGR